MLLDELDKLDSDWRGNPAAALMEVLDPAHNHAFRDNYLEAEYDLSRVFFIATANDVDAHPGDAVRPAGGPPPERLHAAGEARHRQPAPAAARGARHGAAARRRRLRSRRAAGDRPWLHARGGRARARARPAAHRPQGRAQTPGGRPRPAGHGAARELRGYLGEAAGWRPSCRARRASGRASASPTRRRRRGAHHRGDHRRRPRRARAHGSAGRGHAGVRRPRPGVACLRTWSATAGLRPLVRRSPFVTADGLDLANQDVRVHVPEGAVPKDGPSAGLALAVAMLSRSTAPVQAPGRHERARSR